jgi:hypothetical protein
MLVTVALIATLLTATWGPATSAGRERGHAGAPGDTRLRVMAWNIRNTRLDGIDPNFAGGDRNQDDTLEFLRREQPDVLFVVETYGAGEDIEAGLNRGVPRHARYTGVQITEGTQEQEAEPDRDNLWLFTRYPVIEKHPTINQDRLSSFNFGGVRIQLPSGKQVELFTTWLWHADWAWGNTDDSALDIRYGLRRRWTDEQIVGTDMVRRYQMAQTIVEERLPAFVGDGDTPVIMGGDFNTMSHLDWSEEFADAPGHEGLVLDWPVMRLFESAGFRDTYREAHPDAGRYPGRTWSPYFGFGYAPGRIDYVLARGDDVRVVDSHTHTKRLRQHQNVYFDDQFPFYSDHGSVTTDLVIEGGGASPFRRPPREREEPFTPKWPRPDGTQVPREEITATATSQHVGFEAGKAIDGDVRTMWHSEWQPKASLPQAITLDLGKQRNVSSLTYQGRVTSRQNGNVTNYRVYTSDDGVRFARVTEGEWEPNLWEKETRIHRRARYVRFEATWGFDATWLTLNEDPGFAAASEMRVYETSPRRRD